MRGRMIEAPSEPGKPNDTGWAEAQGACGIYYPLILFLSFFFALYH